MSTYGDILSAFPELLKEYQIFTMTPQVGGGYSDRTPLFKKVGSFIKESRSLMMAQGEARVTNEAGVFYCHEFTVEQMLPQGVYFEEDNQIFVIKDDRTFAKEGGFGAYGCQLVQGFTDKQVENMNVETRVITDYPI